MKTGLKWHGLLYPPKVFCLKTLSLGTLCLHALEPQLHHMLIVAVNKSLHLSKRAVDISAAAIPLKRARAWKSYR